MWLVQLMCECYLLLSTDWLPRFHWRPSWIPQLSMVVNIAILEQAPLIQQLAYSALLWFYGGTMLLILLHALLPLTANWPATHCVHAPWPSRLWEKPAAQSVHSLCSTTDE